jgi:hypothetical protein
LKARYLLRRRVPGAIIDEPELRRIMGIVVALADSLSNRTGRLAASLKAGMTGIISIEP